MVAGVNQWPFRIVAFKAFIKSDEPYTEVVLIEELANIVDDAV
jgi:hypothetical protein